MQHSTLEPRLKGKTLPGAISGSPVVGITKHGGDRMVTFSDGTRKTYTKNQLHRLFVARLQTDQAKQALRSLRATPRGTHKVTIGGRVEGERREYQHRGNALGAIRRAYPKASKQELPKGYYVK